MRPIELTEDQIAEMNKALTEGHEVYWLERGDGTHHAFPLNTIPRNATITSASIPTADDEEGQR